MCTAEGAGDGGSTVRMHDAGPASRALPDAEDGILLAPPASYWVPRVHGPYGQLLDA